MQKSSNTTLLLDNNNKISDSHKYLFDRVKDWRITKPLARRLIKTNNRYKTYCNKVGRMGEQYASYNIRYNLWSHGFKESRKTLPMTYSLLNQYRRRKGRDGIDIYIRLTDENNITLRYLIEVCNWAKYRDINDFMFETRILSKFQRYDKDNLHHHVILINRRNIRLLADRCKKHNILIIGMNEHITPSFLEKRLEKMDLLPYEEYEDMLTTTDMNSLL